MFLVLTWLWRVVVGVGVGVEAGLRLGAGGEVGVGWDMGQIRMMQAGFPLTRAQIWRPRQILIVVRVQLVLGQGGVPVLIRG